MITLLKKEGQHLLTFQLDSTLHPSLTTQISSRNHQILTVYYIPHTITPETLQNGYRRESSTVSTSSGAILPPPRDCGRDHTIFFASTAEHASLRELVMKQVFTSTQCRWDYTLECTHANVLFASLRLGSIAPNFQAETTQGPIDFHEFIGNNWVVLFSHPEDYTPVCTTELGAFAKLEPEFTKRGVKLIGLSANTIESHGGWIKDIDEIAGSKLSFPIIGDKERKVAYLYDM
jgi:peroxiredoxin